MTQRPSHRNTGLFETAVWAAIACVSLTISFLLRFEFTLPPQAVALWKGALVICLLAKVPIFYFAGLHRSVRRFAGLSDGLRLSSANTVGSAAFTVGVVLWAWPAFPRSIPIIDFLICFLLTASFHFSERIRREMIQRQPSSRVQKGILIYGAGVAGTTLLREIHDRRSLECNVIGFLDDDPTKRHALVLGVPVLGCGRETASIVDRLNKRRLTVHEIVLALPSASGFQMREAIANCRAARVPCRTLPGVRELLNGKVLSQIREPAVQDLLGRQPVQLDQTPVRQSIEDRCVLVTGAAGSIGSELCRQIAKFDPARLVALDQAESELFRIENELRDRFPNLNLVAAIGDIREPERLSELIESHAIDSVFHAAAYKHVPMMEAHALEAVRNNVLGTWNLVQAVRAHRVPRLLMISSDKAVNPTSLMGATKRICELLVSAVPENVAGIIKCVSVRFGNVLGSNGSVVPIFQSQIAKGGPVKITHPEMQRFFMTTSEAVSLVLQASTMTNGSEIFVLDMGEPVRIVDLATNMIRLAGRVPDEDIEIQFTGLRPGEKLQEEINRSTEKMLPTVHQKIKIFLDDRAEWESITDWIGQLRALLAERQAQDVIAHIRLLVPEYHTKAAPPVHQEPVLIAANGRR